MSLGRVTTLALHNSTLRDAMRTSATLAEMQMQLSSGMRSRTFEGMVNQSEQFLLLEARISKVQAYQETNKVVGTRIDTTSAVLDQIIETATSLRNLISQRRTASNENSLAFPEQLNGLWNTLVSQLNTNMEGRFLFSGTRTDGPAVSATTFPTLEVSGTPDDSYYLGSKDNVTVRADDNVDMVYNIRADDEGFQKIFAAMAMGKMGHESNNQEDLRRAFELVSEGIDGVIAAQAKVNANKISLEQITTRQSALKLYWTGVKEEISQTDLVAVSTQVAVNQGILQASFQTFARINSLRLSDFLR